jgi:predicted mannosyl-3-phosphoglycerate phosphatase (HAD superfamily)
MIGFPAYHVFLAFRCTVFGLLGDGMTDFPVFHYFLYRFRVSGQQKVN